MRRIRVPNIFAGVSAGFPSMFPGIFAVFPGTFPISWYISHFPSLSVLI